MTMIPMPIDDGFEKREKQYIKILDKKTADLLQESGFLYMIEKYNASQEIYVFEKTEVLMSLLDEMRRGENFGEVCIVEDDTLLF